MKKFKATPFEILLAVLIIIYAMVGTSNCIESKKTNVLKNELYVETVRQNELLIEVIDCQNRELKWDDKQ